MGVGRVGRILCVGLALAVAGCGGEPEQQTRSAEDAAVLAAVGHARKMSGTFRFEVSADERSSTFDVEVADGNYHLRRVAASDDMSQGPTELLFLSDGRNLSRTGESPWTVSLQAAGTGNPASILDGLAGMSGYKKDGTESLDGRDTTRYVATAATPEQVMAMMGLGSIARSGGGQVGEMMGKFLAKTSSMQETAWVDAKGGLAQAKFELENSAGKRPDCELLPGELTLTVSGVTVDESMTVSAPPPDQVTEAAPTTLPLAASGDMAEAIAGCFK